MNVLIIDRGHHEVIHLILDSFSNRKNMSFTVVAPYTIRHFFKNRSEDIVFKKNVSVLTKAEIAKMERVVFSTVTDENLKQCHRLAQKWAKSITKEWIVHNLNSWILRPHDPKRRLTVENIRKKNFLALMDEITVLDYPLKEELEKAPFLTDKKLGLLLPRPVFTIEKEAIQAYPKRFTLLIPGAVLGDRRNYLGVFTCLMRLDREQLLETKLVLLGRLPVSADSNGLNGLISRKTRAKTKKQDTFLRKVRSYISLLTKKGLEIETYSHEINQAHFSKKLREADLIIAPVAKSIEVDGIEEYYGKTKFSGTLNDIRLYNKKALVPQHVWHSQLNANRISAYDDIKDLELQIMKHLKTQKQPECK